MAQEILVCQRLVYLIVYTLIDPTPYPKFDLPERVSINYPLHLFSNSEFKNGGGVSTQGNSEEISAQCDQNFISL